MKQVVNWHLRLSLQPMVCISPVTFLYSFFHWPGLECKLGLYTNISPVIPQPSYCTLFQASLNLGFSFFQRILKISTLKSSMWRDILRFTGKFPAFLSLLWNLPKCITSKAKKPKTLASELKQGEYLCTSHCEIEIEGRRYTVLWELKPKGEAINLPSNPQSAAHDCPSDFDDESDEDDGSDENEESQEPHASTSHCLPFKVMGTCYSAERQKALEESFEYLYEHDRPLFVKIEAEPDNVYDRNAIAVYIKASSEYTKVGYLACEVTQFLHPLLNDPALEVSVNKIRFCTTFLMIGFYLTIDITRQGLWEKAVVKACSKVK